MIFLLYYSDGSTQYCRAKDVRAVCAMRNTVKTLAHITHGWGEQYEYAANVWIPAGRQFFVPVSEVIRLLVFTNDYPSKCKFIRAWQDKFISFICKMHIRRFRENSKDLYIHVNHIDEFVNTYRRKMR